jgi:hypothetical protein
VVRWDADELPEVQPRVPEVLPPQADPMPVPVAGRHIPIG